FAEGCKNAGNRSFKSCLKSVSTVHDTKELHPYQLQNKFWGEVKEDWPFYTAEEKFIVRLNKAQHTQGKKGKFPTFTLPSLSTHISRDSRPKEHSISSALNNEATNVLDPTAKKRWGDPMVTRPDPVITRSKNTKQIQKDNTFHQSEFPAIHPRRKPVLFDNPMYYSPYTSSNPIIDDYQINAHHGYSDMNSYPSFNQNAINLFDNNMYFVPPVVRPYNFINNYLQQSHPRKYIRYNELIQNNSNLQQTRSSEHFRYNKPDLDDNNNILQEPHSSKYFGYNDPIRNNINLQQTHISEYFGNNEPTRNNYLQQTHPSEYFGYDEPIRNNNNLQQTHLSEYFGYNEPIRNNNNLQETYPSEYFRINAPIKTNPSNIDKCENKSSLNKQNFSRDNEHQPPKYLHATQNKKETNKVIESLTNQGTIYNAKSSSETLTDKDLIHFSEKNHGEATHDHNEAIQTHKGYENTLNQPIVNKTIRDSIKFLESINLPTEPCRITENEKIPKLYGEGYTTKSFNNGNAPSESCIQHGSVPVTRSQDLDSGNKLISETGKQNTHTHNGMMVGNRSPLENPNEAVKEADISNIIAVSSSKDPKSYICDRSQKDVTNQDTSAQNFQTLFHKEGIGFSYKMLKFD
ncbi:unnamed protein product, partial [Meganyctiphanes norvegica]